MKHIVFYYITPHFVKLANVKKALLNILRLHWFIGLTTFKNSKLLIRLSSYFTVVKLLLQVTWK